MFDFGQPWNDMTVSQNTPASVSYKEHFYHITVRKGNINPFQSVIKFLDIKNVFLKGWLESGELTIEMCSKTSEK